MCVRERSRGEEEEDTMYLLPVILFTKDKTIVPHLYCNKDLVNILELQPRKMYCYNIKNISNFVKNAARSRNNGN